MNYPQGDLRDQLAYVGQDVVRAGLVVGSGGNLSARLPDGDSCWVTASGTWLDRLARRSFVRVRISDGSVLPDDPAYPGGPVGSDRPGHVDGAVGSDGSVHAAGPVLPAGQALRDRATLLDGTTLPMPRAPLIVPSSAADVGPVPDASAATPSDRSGPGSVPTSEVALHLATYRARPDVRAVVHLHPQTVLLLDALGERIRLVSTDHGFYLRRVAQVPFRLPGTTELAELAADATRDGTNCLVLSRHGCSVLGDSVELAHKRAANLEEAARLTYRALVAGRLVQLPELPAEFLDRLDGGATTV